MGSKPPDHELKALLSDPKTAMRVTYLVGSPMVNRFPSLSISHSPS